MSGEYDDIIGLPHPDPKNHTRMTMMQRAAQFAPFAALTGYGEAITETARRTDSRIELDEYTNEMLDRKLHLIKENLNDEPKAVTIVYYKPDGKKAGGAYLSVTDRVKSIDERKRLIVMENGTKIALENIADIVMDA